MTKRAFSPPDKKRQRFSTSSPPKPKQPASDRSEPIVAFGKALINISQTDLLPSSCSIEFCAKYPILTLAPSDTAPSSGVFSCATSLSSVDFPAPLAPITHQRSPRLI